LNYHAPDGADSRFYGWWGDMEFGPHLLITLAARTQGSVDVIYHAPIKVDEFDNRKALAAQLEQDVRAGHAQSLAVIEE
jgi:1-acyl-sn-glycerol-3-phosphate acyltransferase